MDGVWFYDGMQIDDLSIEPTLNCTGSINYPSFSVKTCRGGTLCAALSMCERKKKEKSGDSYLPRCRRWPSQPSTYKVIWLLSSQSSDVLARPETAPAFSLKSWAKPKPWLFTVLFPPLQFLSGTECFLVFLIIFQLGSERFLVILSDYERLWTTLYKI